MKKINENTPTMPAPTGSGNIGQDFAAAKKQISGFLTKLGTAFQEYEERTKRLNMTLQQRISPLANASKGAEERIAELEDQYKQLQDESSQALKLANDTITQLRKQLSDVQSSAGTDQQRIQIAHGQIQQLEQDVADKTQAIENFMRRLDKARDRIREMGKAHDSDRQEFARAMDAYEHEVEKLKKMNAELQKKSDEAVDKFNELLGGVTNQASGAPTESVKMQKILEEYRSYGNFDLLDHLKRAKEKTKKSSDW